MVHHQFYAFSVCVIVKRFNIEVRIRGYEVEHIILTMTEPVFPTYVPAFYKHLVKAVFSSKVYIVAHLIVIGSVSAVRFHLSIIYLIEFDSRQVVSICPRAFAGNHLPPNAYVFHRFNPRSISKSARVIKVEDKA